MRRPAPLLALSAALAGAVLVGACATPVAPTGGPADQTPPTLVASLPATGATRVTERTLTLQFSERLDAATAARAVRVTPEADDGVAPRVTVSGAEVTVELPPLREATTYVVTVGTDLTDARRVRLGAPVVVAFSTGDRIDAGEIEGAVREPVAGRPAAGLAVWAYAADASDSLAADSAAGTAALDPRRRAPDYRTETGTDGRFLLGFLRPGPYRVVAVADANRNGRADDGEAFAVPPTPTVRADTTGGVSLALFVARADTTAPTVRAVRALSSRRLSVRVSEAVVLRAAAGGWTAEDSVSGATLPLRPYQTGPAEVSLVAMGTLPAVTRLRLAAADAAADSAGNPLAPFVRSVALTGASPDTATVRLAAWVPAARPDSIRVLAPGEWPGARFTLPPDTSALRLTDATGAALATRIETDDGLTVRLVPTVPAQAGGAVLTLSVAQGDTTLVRRYRVASADETGGIVGTVPGVAGDRVVVEAMREGSVPVTTLAGADGRFAFSRLLPGRYRLRAWADRDGDGRWTGGRLAPYAPPERLVLVAEPVTVRVRWDTDVEPERLTLPALP